jgi:hypothetical protein
MAVREIAASFRFACDGCGDTEEMPSKSRPKYWSDLHILRDAYDYQGCAVADGSVKLTLCLACGNAATTALNKALDERRARGGLDADSPAERPAEQASPKGENGQ